eukprot:scaffold4967_cov115-Skeletonema_menzelii.AAC.1
MFVVSERMGKLMDYHGYDGPDVSQVGRGSRDTRSLRDSSTQDYLCIVRPTIERLRSVFDVQPPVERLIDIAAMRDRLLQHARGDGRTMFRREKLTSIEKEELAEDAGKMLLMLAASNDLDKPMFVPSSLLASVSIGEVIEGLETIKGGEIAVQMSLQLNRTSSGMERKFNSLPDRKKVLGTRIDELHWPMNPVDSISFLIRRLIPIKFLVEFDDDYYDATEEEKEQKWNDYITNFWLGVREPIRQLFVAVYNEEVAPRFTDRDRIPADAPTRDVSIDTLKWIIELPYEYFRKKLADRIWRDIEPSLREEIFAIYHQQVEKFCEAIQEEYHSVYSETSSLEHNAKLILDIFLEVPPRNDVDLRFPGSLTPEACDTFVDRMEGAMNRWNELIELAKADEGVLWDSKTISELESFEPMFGLHVDCRGRTSTLEFCVPIMVEEFLYRKLASTKGMPIHGGEYKFKSELKKFWDDYIRNWSMSLPHSESVERETRAMRLEQDFRTLSTSKHTREHAMIALVPLLPHLSRHDCKRLVYALFIQRKGNQDNRRILSRSSFSSRNFTYTDTSFIKGIPCARGDESDLSRLIVWHNQKQTYDIHNSYEVLDYILGLPLPENIISSMGEFMVENLYPGGIGDVDENTASNVSRVTCFLRRFCYERPKSAHIVWDYMREAIQNAIAAVENSDSIHRDRREVVIEILVATCIDMRAKRLLSHLRRLYQGTPLDLLPVNFLDFRTLVERIKKPLIINDTLRYHQLRSDYHYV